MNRSTAAKLAKKLNSEGKNYSEISKILAESGYLSQRTGKELSPGGVQRLIVPLDYKAYKQQKAKKESNERNKFERSVLATMLTIIGLDLDDETKLKAIKGLLA